jgi:hypothetical protein
MSDVRFERVAPVLPVRNMRAALDRFARLGFRTRPYIELPLSPENDPIYGYLVWDAVEIHLSAYGALDPETNVATCYVFVDDADAVYAAWSGAGVEGRLAAPTDTSYGNREFHYVDPDGNLFRVGSNSTQ